MREAIKCSQYNAAEHYAAAGALVLLISNTRAPAAA